MNSKLLQEVEHQVVAAADESKGPVNPDTLAAAVQAFLAFDAEDYVSGTERRVVLWTHALSHFTDMLWESRQHEHLQTLYREANKRSSETGDYGCMDRLLRSFLRYARWFDNPRDYGFGETVPDYERLSAEREGHQHLLDFVETRGIKYAYEQELTRLRLKGFVNSYEACRWESLQSVGWQQRER